MNTKKKINQMCIVNGETYKILKTFGILITQIYWITLT